MKTRNKIAMPPELAAALALADAALEDSRAKRKKARKKLMAYETIGEAAPEVLVAAEETAGRHVVLARRLVEAIHGFYGEQQFVIAAATEGGAS